MQTFCTEIKWYVCVIFDDFLTPLFFLQISSPPLRGALILRGHPLVQSSSSSAPSPSHFFQQSDVDNKDISYQHDGSDFRWDAFSTKVIAKLWGKII